MKQVFIILLGSAMFFTACTNAPEADQANASEKQEVAAIDGTSYAIDLSGSNIGWIGTKVGGQHNGDFKVKEGSLLVSEGNVTGGSFVIDMSSVVVTDLEGKDKTDLEGHLKSADFFSTEEFPTASFEITAISPFDPATMTSKLEGASHMISGNLSMRGTTKNVTFPASVSIENGKVAAKADFNIDRSEWGVNFKGPNNPADWIIAKEVNLKLDILATPATM